MGSGWIIGEFVIVALILIECMVQGFVHAL